MNITARHRDRTRDVIVLILFLAACLGVSAVGGAVTASSVGTWYQLLQKPAFNPPDGIFAPVWTALYIMMAVAVWRVWRRHGLRGARRAMVLFALQLALNLAWSVLFFGLRLIGPALAEITLLFVAIVATAIAFWRHDRLAGLLLLPYAAWVAFASLLNAALWHLNPAA